MVNILNVDFGIVKLPKLLYNYDQKAGILDLAIHLNDFILTESRLINLTGRINIDQGISNIESYQHFHLEIKTEN